MNPPPSKEQQPQEAPPRPDTLAAVRSRVGGMGILQQLNNLAKIARRRAQS